MTHVVGTRYLTEDRLIARGGRLGRHVEHDERSRSFAVEETATLTSKLWPRTTPILDQGDLGSCTGNAATVAAACHPIVDGLPANTPKLDENEAVHLYELATVLDSFPGAYPPDDTGSSGIAVAKACVQEKLIAGYKHSFSLAAMQSGLQDGPCIFGLPWMSTFDTPDDDGVISWGGHERGGHEILIRGISMDREAFLCDNSWGTSWGSQGQFIMPFDVAQKCIDNEADATFFVPMTQPKPTPTPTPPKLTPTAEDRKLRSAQDTWRRAYDWTTK
jgi:hypothetical protein